MEDLINYRSLGCVSVVHSANTARQRTYWFPGTTGSPSVRRRGQVVEPVVERIPEIHQTGSQRLSYHRGQDQLCHHSDT